MKKTLELNSERYRALALALTNRILVVKDLIIILENQHEEPGTEGYEEQQELLGIYRRELEVLEEMREELDR